MVEKFGNALRVAFATPIACVRWRIVAGLLRRKYSCGLLILSRIGVLPIEWSGKLT